MPLALWRGVLPGNVELRLDTVAHSIEWRPGRVEIAAHSSAGYSRGVFSAPQAVVALPLGVLKRSGIRISPVPDSWRANLALLEMGEVVRVLLAFRQPFGEAREEGRELSFLHSLQAAIPTWWTARPAEVPVLTGWAGGARAMPLLAGGESHVVRCALESLSFIFDRPVDDLRDLFASWRLHDSTADPFSCGAYSFGLPGGAKAGGKLATPEPCMAPSRVARATRGSS